MDVKTEVSKDGTEMACKGTNIVTGFGMGPGLAELEWMDRIEKAPRISIN